MQSVPRSIHRFSSVTNATKLSVSFINCKITPDDMRELLLVKVKRVKRVITISFVKLKRKDQHQRIVRMMRLHTNTVERHSQTRTFELTQETSHTSASTVARDLVEVVTYNGTFELTLETSHTSASTVARDLVIVVVYSCTFELTLETSHTSASTVARDLVVVVTYSGTFELTLETSHTSASTVARDLVKVVAYSCTFELTLETNHTSAKLWNMFHSQYQFELSY